MPAGKKVSVIFWTIAAPKREELDQAVERYRHPDAFDHELVQAWTRTQVQMRHLGITSQQAAAFQHLARYLVYPDMHLRADRETLQAGLQPQSVLWPMSISGDFPIFVLRINDEMDISVAREALSAQEYLRSRGITADLVIINERAASYAQEMQHTLEGMCEKLRRMGQAESGRPHVFALRRDIMDDATFDAIIAAARVVLHARNGKLIDQINRAVSLFAAPLDADAFQRPLLGADSFAPVGAVDASGLDFWNGFGGFDKQGAEYVIRLRAGQCTPQPWINVIANDRFGFHVAAEGGGYTWGQNSRDYQLTPWGNDPVANRPVEGFYISDAASGDVVSPFSSLSVGRDAIFETRHGLGYSVFSTVDANLKVTLAQTVDRDRPVKLSIMTIRNQGSEARRLRV